MPSDRSRTFASGTGTVAAPSAGLPSTGTTPGRYRGVGQQERFGQTERKDTWWLMPVAQALGLTILIGYANYAAFLGAAHYHFVSEGRDYLSPFYSPYLKPGWLPNFVSPALLILIFPLGFRTTCYYYRKAYYRAFFADPIACAVGELKPKGYCGELKFPFILQNLHRYFLYAALAFLFILWWDVIKAFAFADAGGHHFFAIGVGSLAILASTGLLTLYTLSCHSLRHIVGGKLDCFSCAVAGGPRQSAWSFVTRLNGHHMGLAWWSLLGVCFADFYVRMCSMGVFHDPLLMTFHRALDMPVKPF
jgi:hypothetical protein